VNFKANKATWTSVAVGVVIAAGAIANTLSIPNTFSPHTPALAAQVNANFQAVKASVDDNDARIAALEAAANCPSGFTRADKWCGESTPRAANTWYVAAATCKAAGMRLCPFALFQAGYLPVSHPVGNGDAEWTSDIVSSLSTFLPLRAVYTNSALALSGVVPGTSVNDQLNNDACGLLPYRCCR
jgi:hypothetical protein